jgi:SRSO17 transposase
VGLESKARGSESRFAAYVEAITSALGHADRAAPFQSYCAGLLLSGERKSVEPMAARVQPGRVQAAHQSLHHFVAKADWSDDTVLTTVRARVLPIIKRHGPIRALIVDDTGMQWSGRGRRTSAIRRDIEHQPISAKQLALDLPKKAWRRVSWREGSNTRLASRFAAVRVRPTHRDYHRSTPRPEVWYGA